MDRSVIGPRLDPSNWVDAHGDCLFRFALARVRDRESAEELVQQTFLAALAARDTFGGRSSERTWLIAILKRKIIDWLRDAIRQRACQGIPPDVATDSMFTRFGKWRLKAAEWSSSDPGLELNRVEFQETLAACLDKLPARHRQVVVLTYLEERSPDDIQRTAEVTATNLAVMLHRARLRLWRCLAVNWFGEDPRTLAEGQM